MKTELVINNVGKTLMEAMDNLGMAEVSLGLPHASLVHLLPYPKAFVQRRKIGGNEALLYLVHCEENMLQTFESSDYALSLGKVLQTGMLIFTGENAYLKEQQLLLSSKAYSTRDLAIYAWSHKMKVLQEEVKQLEFPAAPTVTKQNYDMIEAKSSPAQACLDVAQRLTGLLNTFRAQALSFAPNEGVEEIVEEVDELKAPVEELDRIARKFLKEAYQIIKSL
jgi:hypothetical protein